jgi:signal transduction histidine kinase
VRRRVAIAVAVHVAATIGLLVLAAHGDGLRPSSLLAVTGLVGGFALSGLVPLHLGFRRNACTVVLTEAVLVIGLFATGPVGVVVAAAVGEALGCLAYRQRPLKAIFNTSQNAAAAALAAVVFATLWPHADDSLAVAGWVAAGAAAGCFALVNIASTAYVVALAERIQHGGGRGRLFDQAILTTLPIYVFTTSASAALGITVVALFAIHPGAPVLVLPLLGMTVFESQTMAAHRSERLRFERLYQASTRTSHLAGFDDALALHAAEARKLVTGAVGLCCAQAPDGTWRGVIVDDRGPREAAPDLVTTLVGMDDAGLDHVDVDHLPAVVTQVLPSAIDLAIASSGPDAAAPVLLAVLREIREDDGPETFAAVLDAFAGHAALGVANARLYDEIDTAYRHQLDLNRQKDDFVAAVSHELRTPLTTIIGAVQTVHRFGERLATDDRDQLLSDTITQGQRLRVLIDDLLLVAAAEHRSMDVDLRALELEPFLRSVTTAFASADRERITVSAGLDAVVCDEHKLYRILANLVENAVKYAPSGLIEVGAAADDDGWVLLTVADRGPGIAAPDRERIFERFVQLDQSSKRTRGGTGLGLHLCRQLADLLGGSLGASEREGGGTVFTLRLPPACVGVDAASPEAGAALPPAADADAGERAPAPADPVRPGRPVAV